jgi:hypothetical protein
MTSLPKLRVMADYGSSGIWADGEFGPFRHGMVRHSDLSLPPALAIAFDAWIERYWDRKAWSDLDTVSFNQDGRALAVRLKEFVGPSTVVAFQPELWPSGLGPEELLP